MSNVTGLQESTAFNSPLRFFVPYIILGELHDEMHISLLQPSQNQMGLSQPCYHSVILSALVL